MRGAPSSGGGAGARAGLAAEEEERMVQEAIRQSLTPSGGHTPSAPRCAAWPACGRGRVQGRRG